MAIYKTTELLFACSLCRQLHHPAAAPIDRCCNCGHKYMIKRFDDPSWPTADKARAYCKICGAAYLHPPRRNHCRHCLQGGSIIFTKERT